MSPDDGENADLMCAANQVRKDVTLYCQVKGLVSFRFMLKGWETYFSFCFVHLFIHIIKLICLFVLFFSSVKLLLTPGTVSAAFPP